ncbi:MAG: hypothetical protein IPM18_01455 [Phycisphaerales bacterium]|nr:hypothetical protein [Phycisphaerales bacterium]
MRNWLLIGLLAAGATLLTGCATMTRTGAENWADATQRMEIDLRALGDDVNLVIMNKKSTRLTRYYIP